MLQTADGALAVIDEKLIRMKELAEQAATGTYDSVQRLIIDSEFQQMASEINRIANATDFNGIHLLNGNLSGAHNGRGLTSTGAMKIHFGSGNDSAEDYYYIEIGSATIESLFGLKNKSKNQQGQVTPSGENPGSGDNPGGGDDPGGGDNPGGDNPGGGDDPGGGDNPSGGPSTIDNSATPEKSTKSGVSVGTYEKTIKVNSKSYTQSVHGRTTSGYDNVRDVSLHFLNDFTFEGNFDFDIAYGVGDPIVSGLPDGYNYLADGSSTRANRDSILGTTLNYSNNNWTVTNVDSTLSPVINTTRSNDSRVSLSLNGDPNTISFDMLILNQSGTQRQALPHNSNVSVTFNLYKGYAIENNNTNYPNMRIVGNSTSFQIDFDNDGTFDLEGQFINSSPGTFSSGYASFRHTRSTSNISTSTNRSLLSKNNSNINNNLTKIENNSSGAVNQINSLKFNNSNKIENVSDDFTISTQESAQKMLNRVDGAITSKDKIRAHLGAMQNRLENTITNITTQAENLQASESRISDIDVATEMTNFVRNQILAQSAVAMLSQANSMPQMAMQLIGG